MNKAEIKRVEVCKNVYNDSKRCYYYVRIMYLKKIYSKTFGYTIDGKKIALEKAIKWKREKQRVLGIERNQKLISQCNSDYMSIKIDRNIYDYTKLGCICFKLANENMVYSKTISYNDTNRSEILQSIIEYKNEILFELGIQIR